MNILMVGLHYHGYTEAIACELRKQGHEVRLYDLQPRDLVMKTLRVAAPKLWQARLDRLHRQILAVEREKPADLVLFIQTHQMSHANLAAFRRAFANARFALYNWDSLANHNYLDRAQYFDTVQTFDAGDAAKHGFEYLPLFATRDFQGVPNRVDDVHSVYFVGNIVNPKRYAAIDAFRQYCFEEGIDFRAYMACTPPVRHLLAKDGIKPVGLSKGSIARDKFRAMLETSNAVYDFANHDQTGYTMRVFENLCAGKKIITNNARIRYEDFYSEDRILILEEQKFDAVPTFLASPIAQSDEVFAEYHIQSFVRHLARGTGHRNVMAEGAEV